MKRLFLFLALLGGFALSVRAQSDLLLINPETRSMAMGGVAMTTISSSNTIFNNASLVSFADAPFQIATSYAGSQSSKYYSLSTYYQFFSGGAIQAGWRRWDYDNYNSMAVELGYSRPIARIFSIGITGRYLHGKDADDNSVNGLALDLSASCRIPIGGSSLLVGAKLSNLGGYLSGTNDPLFPIQLTGGAGLNLALSESHRLLISTDVGYCFNPEQYKGSQVSVGLEYELMQLLQIRGGYHFNECSTLYSDYFSVGAGIRFLFFQMEGSYIIAPKSSILHNLYSLNVGLKF